MSADKEKIAEGSAQTTVKKIRRGVSNQTKAVAQLRFHEKMHLLRMVYLSVISIMYLLIGL